VTRLLKVAAQVWRTAATLRAKQSLEVPRLTAALRRLEIDALPLPGDSDITLPPAGGPAWIHRAPDGNIWLVYRFDSSSVFVWRLLTSPPLR
jgi:hypothetical protein